MSFSLHRIWEGCPDDMGARVTAALSEAGCPPDRIDEKPYPSALWSAVSRPSDQLLAKATLICGGAPVELKELDGWRGPGRASLRIGFSSADVRAYSGADA